MSHSLLPTPHLPLEIVTMILSFLDSDVPTERLALVACGLVSRTFMSASRPLAFRDLCITSMDEWRVPQLFTLLKSPECTIADCVTSLECYGMAGVHMDGISIIEPRRWQANILGSGVGQLPSLTALSLQSIIVDHCITPDTIASFISQLRSSKITILHLQLLTFRSFGELCEIVAANPHLETLVIRDCYFRTLSFDMESLGNVVPSGNTLRDFFLCWSEVPSTHHPGFLSPSPLSWLIRHPDRVSNLERLTVHVKMPRVQLFEEATQLLKLAGPTLKMFEFVEFVAFNSDGSNNIISLSKNTNLRELSLPFTITPQPSLPAILKTVNSPDLEDIFVRSVSLNPKVTHLRLDFIVLKNIDKVLAQSNLASVKRLSLYLGVNQTSALRQAVKDAMPRAVERGILCFVDVSDCCSGCHKKVAGSWPH